MVLYSQIYAVKMYLVLLCPSVQHGIWPKVIFNGEHLSWLGSMCYLLCPNWDISESCTSVWDLWSRVHVFAWEFWRYWWWKEWSLCPLLYIQNLNYRNYLETSLSPLLYIHFRITQLNGMETLGTHSNVKTALWLRTFLLPTWLYSLFFTFVLFACVFWLYCGRQ